MNNESIVVPFIVDAGNLNDANIYIDEIILSLRTKFDFNETEIYKINGPDYIGDGKYEANICIPILNKFKCPSKFAIFMDGIICGYYSNIPICCIIWFLFLYILPNKLSLKYREWSSKIKEERNINCYYVRCPICSKLNRCNLLKECNCDCNHNIKKCLKRNFLRKNNGKINATPSKKSSIVNKEK